MHAIALMILGVNLFAVSDGIAKILTQAGYPTAEIVWARYALGLPWLLLLIPLRWPRLQPQDRPGFQFLRGLLPPFASVCVVLSAQTMGMGQMTAIFFVAPLLVAVLAGPLLRERVALASWAAVVLGFTGVLTIVRPGGASIGWTVLFPLGTAFSSALFHLATRALAGVPAVTTLAYTLIVGALVMTPALPFDWQTPDLPHGALMLAGGFAQFGANYALIRAFALAPASTLAPYIYTQMLGAVLFGALAFGEMPDAMTWLGAAIIIGAGMIELQVRRRQLPA